MNGKQQPKPSLRPCATCACFVPAHFDTFKVRMPRCHLNPPSPRVPYHDQSSWPVVPEEGGGCWQWKERAQ